MDLKIYSKIDDMESIVVLLSSFCAVILLLVLFISSIVIQGNYLASSIPFKASISRAIISIF